MPTCELVAAGQASHDRIPWLDVSLRAEDREQHELTRPLLAAVIKQAVLTAAGLMEAVANAERERAAAPSEVPLGEWEATRIKPDYGTHLTTQVLLANAEEAKAALQVCEVACCPYCAGSPGSELMSRMLHLELSFYVADHFRSRHAPHQGVGQRCCLASLRS